MSEKKPPIYPPPPKAAQRFVDAIGVEAAIDLMLSFGGSEIFLPSKPTNRNALERAIGLRNIEKLVASSVEMKTRVPLANKWLAKCLYAQGLSKAAIARKLRITDVRVRRYLSGSNAPPST